MWKAKADWLDWDGHELVFIEKDGKRLSYRKVIDLWREDEKFGAFFTDLLAGRTYAAFRWETPGVNEASVDRDFEFVVIDSPGLERSVDTKTFASYFAPGGASVAAFANMGNDAVLVVPRQDGEPAAYAHLAAFVRKAPREQTLALWKAVGEAMTSCLGDRTVWLSTHGAGVAWVHVRIDSKPKYYGYEAYKARS